MNRLKRYGLLRGTFHLFLASLAMTLAIDYCTKLAFLYSRVSTEDTGVAIAVLVSVYFVGSLFFLIFASKWINQNLLTVLWIYCTICLLFTFWDLIYYGISQSFLSLVVILLFDFIGWFLVFFPLISLVATPTLVISSILDSFKKRI
jgi:hypothetical protein